MALACLVLELLALAVPVPWWRGSLQAVLLAPLRFWSLGQACLLALCLIPRRRRLLSGLWLALTVLMIFRIGQPELRSRAATGSSALRVLTYNIYGGRRSLDQVVETLRSVEDAIWLLQECTSIRTGSPDPLPRLQSEFPGRFFSRCPRQPELVISSRQPLGPGEIVFMGKGVRPAWAQTVRLGERRLDLMNVHFSTSLGGASFSRSRHKLHYLSMTVAARQLQMQHLGEWLRHREKHALVIGGDFNTPPLFGGWSHILDGGGDLRDCFAVSGHGFGWSYPNPDAQIRLDYLWVDRLEPRGCLVLESHGSDHLPVLASLDWRTP